VCGYVTPTLTPFFVGRDAENDEVEIAGTKSIEALRQEIIGLGGDSRLYPLRTQNKRKSQAESEFL
jgi:voltage-gated potassium channel